MVKGRLTILYTANLAGRLDLLPRWFTAIQGMRSQVHGPVALLDLGGSCHADSWECAATEGRAALYVLEAMGYDAICLRPEDCAALDGPAVERLLEGLTTAIVADHPGLIPAARWQTGPWRLPVSWGAVSGRRTLTWCSVPGGMARRQIGSRSG